ncbi:MAG: helix-hairpin-helix domain-containing protein [Gammaproteobacteria bacterium]|nr:helix-hairpin-helix domain-containing protein [Gammaproteobacteria bacterium]
MLFFKKILLLSVFLGCFSAAYAAPVNINNADAELLANNLVGVGVEKAKAIVEYRKKHGAFKVVNDLAQVKGIGKKTIEKNRKNITIGRSSTK